MSNVEIMITFVFHRLIRRSYLEVAMLYFYLITAREESSSTVRGKAFKAKVCAIKKNKTKLSTCPHRRFWLDHITFCD